VLPQIKDFVDTWEDSACVTQVSVRLQRAGYWHMTPELVWAHAVALRELGAELKVIPRGELEFADVWHEGCAQAVPLFILDDNPDYRELFAEASKPLDALVFGGHGHLREPLPPLVMVDACKLVEQTNVFRDAFYRGLLDG
jgi:hypothetical protein